MSTVIVHLTDLHFGRVDGRVTEALIEDVRAQKPDLVAVSGDLTQAARRSEFAAARAFLDRLQAPVLAVPGNHDVSPYRLLERFIDPWRTWRHYVSAETEPLWSNGEVVVAGLNTARAIGYGLDWSLGRVGRGQLERFAERLDGADGRFRIVVAHHPIVPHPSDPDAQVVGRARLAIARFMALKVRLVLSGHLHLGFLRGLSADAVGPHEIVPMVVLGRSATSTRLRGEPNGYNVIRIAGDGWAIEEREWSGEQWRCPA